MAAFDLSESGFWASFKTLPLVVGLYLLLDLREGAGLDLLTLVGHGLYYAVDYLSLALVMVPVCRSTGLSGGYVPLVIANNWASLVAAVMVALFSLLTGPASGDDLSLAGVVLLVLLLFYQWNVIRISLNTRTWASLGIIIINTTASLILGRAADLLF